MLRSTLRHLARRLSRRSTPARKAPRARPWQPAFEELESRLVPTVSVKILGGVLTAQCDSAANTVTVDHVLKAGKGFAEINGQFFSDASYTSIRINGGAGGTVTDVHGNVKPLTVFGDSAKDVVNLGDATNKVQGIKGAVLVEDEAGFSATVNINDQGDSATRTPTLSTVTRSKDTSLGQVTGLGAANIQWDYHDTSAVNLHLGTGAFEVNVNGTGPLTTNISITAPFADIDVGNDNVPANIQGVLNLQTQASRAEVEIFDDNDTSGHTVTLATVSRLNQSSLGQLTGLGSAVITWDYLGTSNLLIDGGKGANSFNIQGTVVTTTVETSGPATINVGSGGSITGIQGELFLENDSGPNNTVNVNSQNDRLITTAFVSGQPATGGLPTLGFLNVPGLANQVFWEAAATSVVNLNLGAGTSTVNVFSTIVPTNIFNHGNATVTVNNGPAGLANIKSPLNLENLGGSDTLIVDDSADTTSPSVTLNTLAGDLGQITGLSAPITFSNAEVSQLTLDLGTATSTVNVLGIGTTTNVFNNGNATINVGNGGFLFGIQGALNLENDGGSSTIFIDNSSDDVGETFNFNVIPGDEFINTFGQLTGTAMSGTITWDNADTSGVNFFGGQGGEQYNIFATGSATSIFGGFGANTFNVNAGGNLGANILGTLTLSGGGNANTGMILLDTNDSNSETFNFNISPPGTGSLTLGSTPAFDLIFSNMNSVALFTNGHSTVNDPSGTVQVF
jgi:hypothetical protein